MRKLLTIQKREKLNNVFAVDEPGVGNANHVYAIPDAKFVDEVFLDEDGLVSTNSCDSHLLHAGIYFQHGARKEFESKMGVLDTDLLEIVRDRLKGFQSGEFATEYNAQALLHVEEALMWLNRRVEDRIERNVLGTEQK